MIVFKYKEESLGGRQHAVYRPVADVYLKIVSHAWIEFHPYIDSGADLTMIPLSLGKLIGLHLDEQKVEQIGGIRGHVPIINTQCHMRIGIEEFVAQVAWALIEDVPPLLGRTDVFDRFTVSFQQSKGVIVFDKPQ